jgi:hypothetical protein
MPLAVKSGSVPAEPSSARVWLADEIGWTDGVGAKRRRREHHQALRTPGCDVHDTGTALLKAGDKRRARIEEHDHEPHSRRRIRPGGHRARSLIEQ